VIVSSFLLSSGFGVTVVLGLSLSWGVGFLEAHPISMPQVIANTRNTS
jgi:hypothetical protein